MPSPDVARVATPPPFRLRLDWPLGVILIVSAALRLVYLDYSHFQGDEIKALYPAGAAFPGFLFDQSKGPGQFLITLFVRLATGGYEEWTTRLPFSLASIASVFVVFQLTREHWGRSAALFTAAMFGGCGLLVAFGRIVQYQSWIMLLIALTTLFMLRAVASKGAGPLYAGFVTYALAVLTHWDAVVFAPTMLLLVAGTCRRRGDTLRGHLKHVMVASLVAGLMVALFYLPYLTGSHFATEVDMLKDRVTSGHGLETFNRTNILLKLYLAPLSLPFGIGCLIVGSAAIAWRARSFASLVIVVWFLTAFSFYMLLGGDPRSHVYAYFTPGLILAGYGLHSLVHLFRTDTARRAAQAGAWVLLSAVAMLSYYMLVDHSIEHPWYRKPLFGYALPNLETGQVNGVFGFPYRRGLAEIGRRFESGELTGSYATNERDAMAAYYFRSTVSEQPTNYVYVHHPLSLERDVPAFVIADYRLIDSIMVQGRKTIDIYTRK